MVVVRDETNNLPNAAETSWESSRWALLQMKWWMSRQDPGVVGA